MHLETDRLFLRQFCESDFEDLYSLFSDPDVMRFVGYGVQDRQDTKRILRRMMRHWQKHGFGIWALILKADGKFVGRCGIGHLHNMKDVELAYALARPYWGQGLATEAVRQTLQYAFEVLRLPRVLGVARPENLASRKVMEKVGMTFQRFGEYDGLDAVMYSIERES